MRKIFCLLATTASAIKSRWLTDLDLKFSQVESTNEIRDESVSERPEPIAMKLMDDSANFSDRCTPSSDCWPSEDEWDKLDI